MAAKLKKNNNINEDINMHNRIAFNLLDMFSLKFNLIENKFILLTISIDSSIEIIHNEQVLYIELNILDLIRGNDAIKIAVIGVGRPLNIFFWVLSILKFANLRAAKIAIKKAIKEMIANGNSSV